MNTTTTKATMCLHRFMLILLLLFVGSSLNAGEIKVKSSESRAAVGENSYSKLQLVNSFTALGYDALSIDNGLFTELSIQDYGCSNKVGEPKLPVMKRFIEIPLGATPTVKITNYSMTEYKLSDYGITNKIAPVQPSASKKMGAKNPDFQYNTATYSSNHYNTDELVSVSTIGIMRNIRLARLEVAPVRYNPGTNTIQVYNDIEYEITFPGADVAATIQLKEDKYSMYYESMMNNQVLNYKSVPTTRANSTKYPVKYVIVSDPMFKTALQPFIKWKTKKGFKVVEAYTDNAAVGKTTTSITSYLKGLYNAGTAADPAPSFVLIVGDVAQVPAYKGTAGSDGGQSCDVYYGDFSGDKLPEIYIGRFSATTTAELQPQIDKTLEYEQYLMPDPSFLGKCVMIAGQDATYGPKHGDGQINSGTTSYFNAAHNLSSFTYPHAVSGSSDAQIIKNVSDGVCFANYTAHGDVTEWVDPKFSSSNVSTLQNNHKYPLMVGNCCLSNSYQLTSFGETLLRASGKGAIGYIGASNVSYWDEDYYFGVGYRGTINATASAYSASALGSYDRAFHDHGEAFGEWYTTMGQMLDAGRLAVEQSGSNLKGYYWEEYNLMGDPSLMIYFGVPSKMTVTATLTSLTTVEIKADPYSYAAVSQNGILLGAALADASGLATVTISSPLSATADVVVTRQNRQPYVGTIAPIGMSIPNTLTSAPALAVFPNPSTGLFTFIGLESDHTIEVYDVVGKLVHREVARVASLSVDLKQQNKGMYFYKVINSATQLSTSGKIVLE
jgi:hypothetical protein